MTRKATKNYIKTRDFPRPDLEPNIGLSHLHKNVMFSFTQFLCKFFMQMFMSLYKGLLQRQTCYSFRPLISYGVWFLIHCK